MPAGFIGGVPQQLRGQHFMAIGEDVRIDHDALTDQTAHRERSVRHVGLHVLDRDPRGGQANRIEISIADQGMHNQIRRLISQHAHFTGMQQRAGRIPAIQWLHQQQRSTRPRRQR